MTNTIQIKRSTVTNTPSALAVGELAYSELSATFFIGASGNTVLAIGGELDVTVQRHSAILDATTASFTTAQQSKLTGIESGADKTDSVNVAAAGAVMDSDFSTNGLMSRTGAGTYTVVTNNSANWNAAYSWGDHSTAGYALASGLSTVATTGDYEDLINKPDLSALQEVQTYAAMGNFPGTGESGSIYIAEDTGYMYRWNGSSYTQMTDQTAIWGQVSGTLANQTDLQNALDAKLNGSAFTNASVKTKYEANANTNAFTDAEKSKLAGIAPGATNNTGTVTSVALSVPTGLSVSGSPITSSGTFSVTLQSGYSIPTTSKQLNWDAAYSWGNHATAGYLNANSTIDGGTF